MKKKMKRDAEYEEVWKNYEYFKNRVTDLTQRLEELEKKEKWEREKLDKEMSFILDQKLNLEDDCREMRDRVREVETELSRLRITHEDKIKILAEESEAQKQKEIQKEKDIQNLKDGHLSERGELFRKLRAKDSEIDNLTEELKAERERAVRDSKKIEEYCMRMRMKEKISNGQRDLIESLKKAIERQTNEIDRLK